jgi:hypothetical protein
VSVFGPAFEALLCELERDIRVAQEEANRRAWRAMMLSGGDIEVWIALLRGESVPVDRLDAEWLVRFGGKRK